MTVNRPFPVVQSAIDLSGPGYVANRENWAPVLERFEAALKEVSSEGTGVSLSRHQERGQLLRAKSLRLRGYRKLT